MTLYEELVADYLDTLKLKGRSPKTLKNYRESLDRLRVSLSPEAREDATLINHRMLQRWLASHGETLAPSTVQKLYRDTRAFFSWLESEGEIPSNPMKRVTPPRDKPRPVPLVSPETVSKLLAAPARGDFNKKRNEALVRVLFDCGVRASELVSITSGDVRWDTRLLVVRGKTGERHVPFGDATAVALRRYRRVRAGHKAQESERFWLGGNGPLEYAGLVEVLHRMCDSVGVERINLHRFRHSFAHEFLDAGGDLISLQALGGWESYRQIAERYGRTGREARAVAAHRRFSPGDRI